MRRFMYASIGILALVLAFSLGAQTGRAGIGGIIGVGNDASNYTFVVRDDGQIWRYYTAKGWAAVGELPFPASELKMFSGSFAVDGNGNLWGALDGGFPLHWVFLGQPPGSTGIGDQPHPTPSTWGSIKARGGK